jgi:hypothetical protein
MRSTGIARLPVEDRCDNEFLKKCKGLPWDVKPRAMRAPGAIDAGVGEGSAPLQRQSVAREAENGPRWRYITISEIDRYGGTERRKACAVVAMGGKGPRPARRDACGARFDKLWAEDVSTEAEAKREADELRRGVAEEKISNAKGKKRTTDQQDPEKVQTGGSSSS